MATTLDFTALPAPSVIEDLSYEDILANMKLAVIAAMPELAAVMALESEPAVKILEVCAAVSLLDRARVNDAARAVMLPYATGADLDNLAALYGVQRLVLDPGNPVAIPPIAPTYEGDDALRRRTQMAPEGFSVAGARGAYVFHALSASAQVKDVSVASPNPGEVQVTILSTTGNGVPSAPLLATVSATLSAETIRPLCDTVVVQAASALNYTVTATLEFNGTGPDQSTVVDAALAATQAYVSACHRIGKAVRLSGIYAALHQPGVARVILASPLADVVPTALQAPYCTLVTVAAA